MTIDLLFWYLMSVIAWKWSGKIPICPSSRCRSLLARLLHGNPNKMCMGSFDSAANLSNGLLNADGFKESSIPNLLGIGIILIAFTV